MDHYHQCTVTVTPKAAPMLTPNTTAVFITKEVPVSTHYPADPSYTTLMELLQHNHSPEDEKKTVKSVLSTIKTASSSSRVAPSLAVATRGLSFAERLLLPSDPALKKISQRAY